MPAFAAILRIPFAVLVPLIVFVCAIGAYTVSNSMVDVWYMLGFGVLGYVFKKLDYPLAPLVLALVLGDMAENALAPEPDHVAGLRAHLRHAPDRGGHHRRGDARCSSCPSSARCSGGRASGPSEAPRA